MLTATLDAVARLDYANFECVLVINNTPDPALWRPVEEHCRALGDRFKFVRVEELAGYKAGALRLALAHTAADAEIIGVLDADYAVDPAWLKDLVPLFADARVGMVQSPQDHRDGDRSPMHRALNAEYAGFFDIGMVQRNEVNAIIMHGTMCLLRRAAIESTGGWSSDTIVEDTDLGLAILERGWLAHYTNHRYGYGLLPDTFEAYKRQRHRWAFGGLQLVRKHWQHLLPWAEGLTREQKREYGLGWLNWLGADSIGVVVALLNIVWVPVVAFANIAVPDRILTLPILAAFMVSVAHFMALYRLRVEVPRRAHARRGVCRDGDAMDGRARGRIGGAEGTPALPAHGEGRRDPQGRLPGLLGGGDRRTPPHRRRDPRRHQLQAGPRDQHLCRRARGAEPALPVRGCDRPDRGHAASTRSTSGAGSRPRPPALLPRSQVIAEPPKLPAENRVEAAQ